LTDADRADWLDAIAERLSGLQTDEGMVVSCSALKRMYRTLEIDFGSTKAASMIVKMAPQFRIDLDW
jgi:gluconate kinase